MLLSKNEIINSIRTFDKLKIKEYLFCKDELQKFLFDTACEIRNNGYFKNNVELRSVIEISNICAQKCRYCSMGNNGKELYTLSREQIIERVKMLASLGRRTFLLQSGEILKQSFVDDIAYCIKTLMELYPDIKFILCMGNLKKEQYAQLKEAGASRYILKFETSNSEHHKFCRPTDTIENRLEHINNLIDLGYKVGSGNIIGLPNQTADNLIEDLLLVKNLKLSMVSATKFIPNEFSEFKNYPVGDINTTLNFLAILRILKPDCLIPATSSLSLGSQSGQLNGLLAGCNTLTIHDGTPKEFKENYSIYSDNRFTPAEEYCLNIIKEAGMKAKRFLI